MIRKEREAKKKFLTSSEVAHVLARYSCGDLLTAFDFPHFHFAIGLLALFLLSCEPRLHSIEQLTVGSITNGHVLDGEVLQLSVLDIGNMRHPALDQHRQRHRAYTRTASQ